MLEAAFPYADGRFHLDCPAARKQRGPGRLASPVGRYGRDTTLHTNGNGRSLVVADSRNRSGCPAHPANHRLRIWRGRHIDPFAGSYLVEELTDEIGNRA